MIEDLKTSKEWMEGIDTVEILDPDGWDRTNFEYSFNEELINYAEFATRLARSTLMFKEVSISETE